MISNHNFKAWDVINNEWYMDGDAFNLDFSGSYGNFYFDNDHPRNMRDVKLQWIQSVGFVDMKGKEIYQKDYLKIHSKGKFIIRMVDWIPELAKFGWGGAVAGGTPHSFSNGNAIKMFEVVGNYFNDPEMR